MTSSDVFILVVRWLHLASAAAWVGGSLFYLVALRPALKRSPEAATAVNQATAREFRALVDTCILVLLLTGAILTFHRLTPGAVGPTYGVVLGVKIALSAWMFFAARRRRSIRPATGAPAPATPLARATRALSGYNALIILGFVVLFLSDLLKLLFENAIAQR